MTTRHRRRRVARATALAALGLATLLAGCGGGGSADAPTPTSRPLRLDEATLLSETRPANYEAGGASFLVSAALLATGDRTQIAGDVDWRTHAGHAVVSSTRADAGVTEVYWADGVVLERVPRLDGPLAEVTGRPVKWVARPPDPQNRPLDRLLALVTGLAATQPDNALLVQQAEGSAFLRRDDLRSVGVEVLRYGTRNRYWIDPATTRTLRFEGDSAAGSAPVVIDLSDHGPRSVSLPPRDQVVSVDAVRDLYDSTR